MRRAVQNLPHYERVAAAYRRAAEICDEDVETCRRIGEHGLKIIRDIAARKAPGEPVKVLTHCNAGWLACVDWGTATSPIYQAHDAGIPCMSGSTRRGRATRARRSPRLSSAATACRTRSSSTTRAAT